MVDSIVKYVLPISTTSYYQIATDLPVLVSKVHFLHGVLSSCFPSSLKLLSHNVTSATEFDKSADNFYADNVQEHDGVKTVHINGIISSSIIGTMAKTLRDCGNVTANSSDDNNNVPKLSDINSDVFKMDKMAFKTIDIRSDEVSVRNPFRITTSIAEESTKGVLNQSRTINAMTQQSSEFLYFKIRLNSSLSELNFCLANHVGNQGGSNDGDRVQSKYGSIACKVMNDIAWSSSDDSKDSFDVIFSDMPQLSFCNVNYE